MSKFNDLMTGRKTERPEPEEPKQQWSKEQTRTALLVVALVVAIAGFIVVSSGVFSGGSDNAAERAMDRRNDQADRELDICFEQADRIADQLGADAGSAHLDQCVEQYGNDRQAVP